jgi:hypothetical protein
VGDRERFQSCGRTGTHSRMILTWSLQHGGQGFVTNLEKENNTKDSISKVGLHP